MGLDVTIYSSFPLKQYNVYMYVIDNYPLNTDIPLKLTVSVVFSVSMLTRFDRRNNSYKNMQKQMIKTDVSESP